jgi:hypothetical protein
MNNTGIANKKTAELDEAMHALNSEIVKCENNIGRLIGKLETERSAVTSEGTKDTPPLTIGEFAKRIFGRVVDMNKTLETVIGRIDEQVGELKLLP